MGDTMYYRTKKTIIDHLREQATIYIFMIVLFLTGIIFGAVIVNSMNFIQKQELFFYVERFFQQMLEGQEIQNQALFKESFFYHMKYLFLMFILGLSVIGLPLVWVLVYLKGLVVGFSVGFLVNQLGFDGLILASLSIAPQNIIAIPIYLIAGTLSMLFSLSILYRLFSRRPTDSIFQPFGRYVASFSVLLAGAVFAALIEVYISTPSMDRVISSFFG